jgi:hypothetical protein
MDSRDHTCVDSMEVGETITVVLKNPRALTEENFEVNVAMDMTLGHLKDLIQSDYPGNPRPGSLTLVYAGKVLRDEGLVLSEVFPKDGSRVAVHMVIRQMVDESSPSIESHATRVPHESAGPSLINEAHVSSQNDVDTPSADTEDNVEHTSSRDMPSTSSSGSMYDSVLRVAYKAALQVIVEEGLQGSAQQNFTFIPAIIPIPRGTIHDREEEQYFNNYMVPMVPMTYALPRARVDRQEQVVRRRNAREENVRALFRAIREGEDDDNNVERIPGRNNQNNQNNNNNNNARQIQIRIHLNVRMLLQVAVLSFILYQHCPPSRFVGISLLGLLFYFSTTRFGRMLLRRLKGHFNMHPPDPNQQVQAQAANDTPLPGDEGEAGIEPEQPQPGLLREIQSFIAGFFASILPAADQHRNGNNAAVVQDVFRGQ